MFTCTFTEYSRVAEVGSVKASAKMAVCVRYCQIANLIQYDMQYIPCNSALLAQKTLFLTQKGTVFQIYKSFGIWEDPPPHVGKNSQIISFFFMRAYLITCNVTDDNKLIKIIFNI